MVTGSPAAVVAAVTLGGKLRMLLSAESVAETHSVLTAESRVRMIVYTFDIYLTASPLRGAKYCNQHVCLSVCLSSVCSHILKTACPYFT